MARTQAFLGGEAPLRALNDDWADVGTLITTSIAASADDGNEVVSTGLVSLIGTTIGFQDDRFAAFLFDFDQVDQGDTIHDARIRFTATFENSSPNSDAGEVTIWCEKNTSPAALSSGTAALTSLTKTTASVIWALPESAGNNLWTVGERGGNQMTPDLSKIIQEVVDLGAITRLVFLFQRTSTGDSMVRQVAAFDHATYQPATLTFRKI